MSKILICGSTSFAAQGIVERLIEAGHDIITFNRGVENRNGNSITGEVNNISSNKFIDDNIDVIINYLLVKNATIEENIEYIKNLLTLCKKANVKHLIHFSSLSVYKASVKLINENARIETDPKKKGDYGAWKVATENFLLENLSDGLKLSLLRPGFILGTGLVNPIVGNAFRTPWNKLMLYGTKKTIMPLISRESVHQTVSKILTANSDQPVNIYALVDNESPSKENYIKKCSQLLGISEDIIALPNFLWLTLGVFGNAATKLIMKKNMGLYQKFYNATRVNHYNSSATQNKLGLSYKMDWEKELISSLDKQEPNFILPEIPETKNKVWFNSINIIGYGRIVKQKHLPALKKLHLQNKINGYDVSNFKDDIAGEVLSIKEHKVNEAELNVISTPGPVHLSTLKSIPLNGSKILIEKPLVYSQSELNELLTLINIKAESLFVCHNYRFKQNVLEMISHIKKYNPGRLLKVDLIFQSPPVSNDSASWLRNERKAKTLLMDYALHFIDLACMLDPGKWNIINVNYTLNELKQTDKISCLLNSANGIEVNFLLRQGFFPRRARIFYTFQNYGTALNFFPDTFTAYMATDNFPVYKLESKALRNSTIKKVFSTLRNKDYDNSHYLVYNSVYNAKEGNKSSISFENLYNFYELLFTLSEQVYN